MDTILCTYDQNQPDEAAASIDLAAKILQQGGLVAFPTETVYGLGGDALDPSASMRIYAAKGRPSDNPLIVHIADKADVWKLAEEVPETAVMLMEAFWPGPLTIILRKKPVVPDATTGGLSTVAIRMPSHPAAMEMIRRSGVYVAAPSANRSGRPSPTTAEHVREDLFGAIDMILDGGPVGIGIESTIVDLTGEVPMILRPGYITREMLSAIVGPVELDPSLEQLDAEVLGGAGAVTASTATTTDSAKTQESAGQTDDPADLSGSTGQTDDQTDISDSTGPTDGRAGIARANGQTDDRAGIARAIGQSGSAGSPGKNSDLPAEDTVMQHPKAPGMRYTHYAPHGTLSIITDREHPEQVTQAVTAEILRLTKEALAEERETAILTTGEHASAYDSLTEVPHFHKILLGDADDGQTVAAHLYGALRTCDTLGCEVIYSESFRRDALGSAIMNRLVKAAGHRVISV